MRFESSIDVDAPAETVWALIDWLKGWPYPEQEVAEGQEMESGRWALLHRLGNLTLLTQPLNSEVSSDPFRIKRPDVTKQSLLVLNSYFHYFSIDDAWNQDAILEPRKHLEDLAFRITAGSRSLVVRGYNHDFTESNSAY